MIFFKRPEKVKQSNLGEFSEESVKALKADLKSAFSGIKNEFQEHLTSINHNTNEIQSNYEFLCEIDSKIEKLSERIDEISMFLGIEKEVRDYQIKPLTLREQEVFLVLYTLQDGSSITYAFVARKLALTENLVQNYISSMIAKGVPVVKKYVNNRVNLSLDPQFKALQAKHNFVGVHRKVADNLLGGKKI